MSTYIYALCVLRYPYDYLLYNNLNTLGAKIDFQYPVAFFFDQKEAEEAKKNHPFFLKYHQFPYYQGRITRNYYWELSILCFRSPFSLPHIWFSNMLSLEHKRRQDPGFAFHSETNQLLSQLVPSFREITQREYTGRRPKFTMDLYLIERETYFQMDNGLGVMYEYEIYPWSPDNKFFQLSTQLLRATSYVYPIQYHALYQPTPEVYPHKDSGINIADLANEFEIDLSD